MKKEIKAIQQTLLANANKSNLANDNEYYVKKAIVWINKNFAKGK